MLHYLHEWKYTRKTKLWCGIGKNRGWGIEGGTPLWDVIIANPTTFQGSHSPPTQSSQALRGCTHCKMYAVHVHYTGGGVQCVLLSQFPVPGAILRTPSLNNLHIPMYSFSFSLTALSQDILDGNAWMTCPVYGENPLLKCCLCCRMQPALSYEPKLESTTELVLEALRDVFCSGCYWANSIV